MQIDPVSGSNNAYIEMRCVERHYGQGRQRRQVLRGVDLQVRRGDSVALLGRSGSGKSTLLNLLSGIDTPDAGEVIVDGRRLGQMSELQATLFRRHSVGFIYQSFNLIPTLTATENIALVLELNNNSRTRIGQRTEQLLTAVGLTGRGDYFPDQLSGGEQQRVAIARALAHHPLLVLADEPTGNLDEESGRAMLALMHAMVREQQGILILVTHSLAVAQSADRVLTLEDGLLSERCGEFAW